MAKQKTIKKRSKVQKNQEEEQSVYEVSYEPKIDQAIRNLPQDIRDELDQLYQQISSNPRKAIPRLLQLKQQYPKVMLICNYLAVAYGHVDREKQIQCIRENYQAHSEYLFARCHYAQLCLQQGDLQQIPAIFNHKFDLKALYPRRSRFHITEYLAFTAVLCDYFNALGKREQAEKIYQGMLDAAPDAEETKQIKQVLYPGFFRRLGNRLKARLSG